MSNATPQTGGQIIEASAFTLRLLLALATPFRPRQLSEVVTHCQAAGLDVTTTKALNHLATLQQCGFAERTDAGAWIVSPRLVTVALAYQAHLADEAARLARLAQVLTPILPAAIPAETPNPEEGVTHAITQ